jgi:hypothetical protein
MFGAIRNAFVGVGDKISSLGMKIGSLNDGSSFDGKKAGLIILLIFSVVFIATISYLFAYKPRKVAQTEGFAVPHGAVLSGCSEGIPELRLVLEKLKGVDNDDAREFVILAGKLACVKSDLTSDANMVRASANQPFVSTHDRQPITETLSQCFSKSIPLRDLGLVFDLYMTRGVELIKRFGPLGIDCASAERTYRDAVNRVYDIAKERCFTNPAAKKLIDINGPAQGDFAEYVLGGAGL